MKFSVAKNKDQQIFSIYYPRTNITCSVSFNSLFLDYSKPQTIQQKTNTLIFARKFKVTLNSRACFQGKKKRLSFSHKAFRERKNIRKIKINIHHSVSIALFKSQEEETRQSQSPLPWASSSNPEVGIIQECWDLMAYSNPVMI